MNSQEPMTEDPQPYKINLDRRFSMKEQALASLYCMGALQHIATLERYLQEKMEGVTDPAIAEELREQLKRAIADLTAVAADLDE